MQQQQYELPLWEDASSAIAFLAAHGTDKGRLDEVETRAGEVFRFLKCAGPLNREAGERDAYQVRPACASAPGSLRP